VTKAAAARRAKTMVVGLLRDGKYPAVVGHRGASAYEAENTLNAFSAAADLGAAAVELDVHLSADGVPVVIHDDDVRRTTDAAETFPGRSSYLVSSFTLRELQKLDAASWFRRGRGRTAADRARTRPAVLGPPNIVPRVPTLKEALHWCGAIGLMSLVEIKSIPNRPRGIAAAVVRVVRESVTADWAMITGFDHGVLAEVRRLAPEIPIGVLSSDRLYDPVAYLRRLEADAFLPGATGMFDSLGLECGRLDGAAIAAVRKAGFAVVPWTVNEMKPMKRLAAAGVSGIITDYPDRANTALGPKAAEGR
jgi:glycerophosphoryl diester phosphodiesterase